MLASFQDYTEHLRPLLAAGFSGQLASLLGGDKLCQSHGENRILTGGKRVRGSLLCLVTSTLGGSTEEALPRAIAVELIQTATLIHDDFVDQHKLRRNSPALWTLEGARRAVLLGDMIFASSIQMMSELGREDGLIVSRAIAEVSQGAYREPLNPCSLLEALETDMEDAALYEKITYLKTAVLFGSACQLGAVAARANDKLQQKWRRYGLKIGEAYQIADDLHEVERYLLTRSITGSEMTSLVPALLFFVRESRPFIIKSLRRESVGFRGELLTHFQAAAEAMKAEIEIRLLAAVSAIEGDFPNNEYGCLARRTPLDIIRMFNEAVPAVSSP